MPTDTDKRLAEIEAQSKSLRHASMSLQVQDAVFDNVEWLISEVRRLRELVVFYGGLESAPCKVCGYNGPGYWQPSQHECARIWHDLEDAGHDR